MTRFDPGNGPSPDDLPDDVRDLLLPAHPDVPSMLAAGEGWNPADVADDAGADDWPIYVPEE